MTKHYIATVNYSSNLEGQSTGSMQVSAVVRKLRASFATSFCNSKKPENNTAKLSSLVPNGNLSAKHEKQ